MRSQQQEGVINNVDEQEITTSLKHMQLDPRFLTEPTIRSGEPINFVDFHIGFLKSHPSLNPRHYLSNLRLILKK